MSDFTPISEPLRRDYSFGDEVPQLAGETEFEKPRGIHRVEVRPGLVRVHISQLTGGLAESRRRVLAYIADAGVSIDFLKLTPTGLSFVVSESRAVAVEQCLTPHGYHTSFHAERSLLIIHAVNMRDEEGLISRVLAEVIRSGVELEHLGDSHDRLLIVVPDSEAEALAARLRGLGEANSGGAA